MSEVAGPFIVTLRIPNRGRLMVDDRRIVSIKVCSFNNYPVAHPLVASVTVYEGYFCTYLKILVHAFYCNSKTKGVCFIFNACHATI